VTNSPSSRQVLGREVSAFVGLGAGVGDLHSAVHLTGTSGRVDNVVNVLHEVWVDGEGLETVCLAGPMGDGARNLLSFPARLAWTFEASSHFEAMSLYHERMGWPPYETDSPDEDNRTYADRGWE
jgi:hypothetical protein